MLKITTKKGRKPNILTSAQNITEAKAINNLVSDVKLSEAQKTLVTIGNHFSFDEYYGLSDSLITKHRRA